METLELLCLGVRGGMWAMGAARTENHGTNTRRNVERTVKRMKEMQIEVFKSVEDLKQLSIRELKVQHPIQQSPAQLCSPRK